MKSPFDDTLPEEGEPQYKELTTMLQQAYSKSVSVTPDRQAQILARVRERLEITDADEGVVSQDIVDIAQFGAPLPREVPRQHRLSRLLTLIAAVLVLGALVVTDLLIFQPRTPSTATHPTVAPPISPLGKPITVHTQANGLEATMRVTPGPYFLSEMLEVELSVTNHSHDTLVVTFLPEKSCTSDLPALLTVMMTGGSGPSDKALQHNLADNLCPSLLGLIPRQLFPPNQTMHMLSKYVVLTNSGHITLTALIGLAKQVPGQSNSYGSLPRSLPNSDPLAGHWPSLQINVQARIPADRLITGQQKGTQVTIEAPPLVRSQLLYISILRCDLNWGPNQNKLTTLILHQPPCDDYMHGNPPNRFIKWTYIVYAVGYAVFSGSTQR